MIRDLKKIHYERQKEIILYSGSKKMKEKSKNCLKHIRDFLPRPCTLSEKSRRILLPGK